MLSSVNMLSCVILCYPVLTCVNLCYPVLSCVILCYPVLSCVNLCYPLLTCVILCYSAFLSGAHATSSSRCAPCMGDQTERKTAGASHWAAVHSLGGGTGAM